MMYHVKTAQFEGPFDLLLDLIEKEEVDVTRLSLAQITDEYVQYVQMQKDISLHHLTDFLSVASQLILIKSHALLPLLQLDEEEENDLNILESQLAALKVFKDHAEIFVTFINNAQSSYGTAGIWGQRAVFCPPENITKEDLHKGFLETMRMIPQLESLEEKIVQDVISLEKRIVIIQKSVQNRAQIAFSELTKNATNRSDVVVSFLAVLELVKQKIVIARQKGLFDDIIFKNESLKK